MDQYVAGAVIKRLRSHFYVCPVCGNIVHSMGETVIQCHGLQLRQETADCPRICMKCITKI